VQQPVAELAALRGEELALPAAPVAPGSPVVLAGAGTALDLELRVRCDAGASLTLALRDGPSGRPVRLRIEPHAGRATLDRTALGTGEGGTSTGAFRAAGEVSVRVLLDHASVEVFLDEGRLAMSARIYPAAGEADVVLTADGGPVQLAGAAWRLAAA
jgi:sucrose-6-phosphate hydrolase SacC (GH32 family)